MKTTDEIREALAGLRVAATTDTERRVVTISFAIDELERLRAEVETHDDDARDYDRMIADLSNEKAKREEAERHLEELQAEGRAALPHVVLGQLERRAERAGEARDKAEADCAAMRLALEDARANVSEATDAGQIIERALATKTGAALLERLAKAEEITETEHWAADMSRFRAERDSLQARVKELEEALTELVRRAAEPDLDPRHRVAALMLAGAVAQAQSALGPSKTEGA